MSSAISHKSNTLASGQQIKEEGLVEKIKKLQLSNGPSLTDFDEKKASIVYQAKKVSTVTNVHRDDIHAAIKLSDRTFITGSKDGCLKKWDFNGKLIKTVYNNPKINYKSWITALVALGDSFWLSGTRDGYVHQWNTKGKLEKQLNVVPYFDGMHQCKQRNIKRVNCLSAFPSSDSPGNHIFFAGWHTHFTTHHLEYDKRIRYSVADQNDWVYAIQSISTTALLVITGPRLDHWERSSSSSYEWKEKTHLIQPPKDDCHPKKTHFISAITPLRSSKQHFGLSVFDGSIRVYDIEAQKIIMKAREHEKRVWTIENITEYCFGSCGDDGLIKIWDIRTPSKSLLTLKDNEKQKARVSILLHIEDNLLLSGSCPVDIKNSANKAQFSFWDIRKV